MALDRAFQDLRHQLQIFHDALVGARMTVIEDRPLLGDSALVDQFGDALEDALGWLEELRLEAQAGEEALVYPTDLERARHALTICQNRFNLLLQRLGSQATSHQRMTDLTLMGRSRGGEWQCWTETVSEAMDRCLTALYDINNALFLCWQDMVIAKGGASVSVQTTNIGQQITVPEGRELVQEATS